MGGEECVDRADLLPQRSDWNCDFGKLAQARHTGVATEQTVTAWTANSADPALGTSHFTSAPRDLLVSHGSSAAPPHDTEDDFCFCLHRKSKAWRKAIFRYPSDVPRRSATFDLEMGKLGQHRLNHGLTDQSLE